MAQAFISASLAKKLNAIYHKPGDVGSFGGIEKLYQRARQLRLKGVTRKIVERFLRGDPSYSLHRKVIRKFHRNPIFVQGIDDQWEADLVDYQKFSRANAGTKYLLTCIDVFSKFAWVIPVKSKSATNMLEGFKELFKQAAPRRPRKLQTDRGKEFLNRRVQQFLREEIPHGPVHHFSSWSDKKCAVVERFNRTLKDRLERYFTLHQTNRYIDVLPQVVSAYNHTIHSSIKMAPAHVKKKHEQQISKRLYAAPIPKKDSIIQSRHKKLLRIGSMVRITNTKNPAFQKGYLPKWTEEDFKIREIQNSQGKTRDSRLHPVYKLEDRAGEPIHGVFYEEELQSIPRNRYLVERIVRRRTIPNSKPPQVEYLVKWQGWPRNFNTWIRSSELKKLGNYGDQFL